MAGATQVELAAGADPQRGQGDAAGRGGGDDPGGHAGVEACQQQFLRVRGGVVAEQAGGFVGVDDELAGVFLAAQVVGGDVGAAAASALPLGTDGEAGFAGLRIGRDRGGEVGQGGGVDGVHVRAPRILVVSYWLRPAMTPPSTSQTAPVTQLARSESRNVMTAATSVVVPIRPIGWKSLNPARAWSTSAGGMNPW